MAKINIEWLWDNHECETCGLSYAEGAVVTIKYPDHDEVIEMKPVAACFDGASFESDEVFKRILKELGHEVVE